MPEPEKPDSVQKRSSEVFEKPVKCATSFLHLPAHIRRDIYVKAGLVIGEDIVLRRREPHISWRSNASKRQDRAYRFIYRILQSCRAVHDEIKELLCAEDRIVVPHDNLDYGFHFLQTLDKSCCSRLRLLYVHLHLQVAPDEKLHSGRFKPSEALAVSHVAAWDSAISRILENTTPGRLQLHLMCDTGDDPLTKEVLRPLIKHPGMLGSCNIRLLPKRRIHLSVKARNVCLRATTGQALDTDSQGKDKPFPFLNLPLELRYKILRETDLVTPWGEVEWTSRRGFNVSFGHHYCLAVKNFKSAIAFNQGPWKLQNCRTPGLDTPVTGLFCRAYQSSYSSRCKCWIPPDAIMLVCREMYQHASHVLYTYNRIIVIPQADAARAELGTDCNPLPARLDASQFITRHCSQSLLSRLRVLELVFPGLNPRLPVRLQPSDHLYVDWCSAVDCLRDHANLDSVTLIVHLRFHFGDSWDLVRCLDNARRFEEYVAEQGSNNETILRPHIFMLKPLQKLRGAGLGRLFVFLEWDWHWSPPQGCAPHRCRGVCGGFETIHRVDRMEVMLEKMVMGEDYDSVARGKMRETPSQWMLDWE